MTDGKKKTNFEIWKESDNVIKVGENEFQTQCSLYIITFTEKELKAYYKREYCNATFKADGFEHYNEGFTDKQEFEVYVKFYDCKNNYKESKKDFKTFGEAWQWIQETFDKPSQDFIYYY